MKANSENYHGSFIITDIILKSQVFLYELKRRIVEATGKLGLAHTSRKLGLNPKVVSNWKHRFAENDQRGLALERPLIQVTRVQALQASIPPPSATLQLGQARFDIFSESLALSLVAQQLERLQ
jgi:transposase-like protein